MPAVDHAHTIFHARPFEPEPPAAVAVEGKIMRAAKRRTHIREVRRVMSMNPFSYH
jgi:hypothetical protein